MDFTTNATESEPALSLEQRYDKILKLTKNDGCGKFQVMVGVAATCAHACFGFIIYTLSFLELMPQFNCVGTPIACVDCST